MAYFEIKYFVPLHKVQVLHQWLDSAYANSDPYGENELDTLYFDTPNSDMYGCSCDGNYVKIKVRMRSYNKKNYSQLQIKKKVGYQVYKKSFKVFYPVDKEVPPDFYYDCFVPDDFSFPKPLVPRTRVIYKRSRYRSRSIRITLDQNIRFSSTQLGLPHIRHEAMLPYAVLELKSDNIKDCILEVNQWNLKFVPTSKFFLGESMLRGRSDILAKYIE